MKFVRVAIDGYGKLLRRTLEFGPGLQVILGPNEQGKSTLRNFIADMLYGQKDDGADADGEARCPWAHAESYGGSLVYRLDSGREYEVRRRFDPKHEAVLLFDLPSGRDVTAEFVQPANDQPAFALAHLGISKPIFLHTATIGDGDLESLGDDNAMHHIRQKLMTLADSGEEDTSANAAVKRLEARIAAIGPAGARNRPLPAAKARLADLDAQWDAALTARREAEQMAARRRQLLDEAQHLRARVQAIDAAMSAHVQQERAQRLEEAETIERETADLTRKCFGLRDAAQFPLEQRADFQRLEMMLGAAEKSLQRLYREREQRAGLAGPGDVETPDIPDDTDRRLADIEERIKALHVRLNEAQAHRANAEKRLAAAELELQALPDFNRIADDPVTWLGQLAGSFRVAQRYRDDEVRKRQALRERIERQQAALAETDQLFARLPDFDNAAREYEVRKRVREEQAVHLGQTMEETQLAAQELEAYIPSFTWLTILIAVFLAALLGVFVMLDNSGLLVAAGMTTLALVYFFSKMVYTRMRHKRVTRDLDDMDVRLARLNADSDLTGILIETMMQQASCQTVRELEARHDVYCKARVELDALLEQAEEIETKARESEERVAQMLESYTRLFSSAGETLQDENDVEAAANRAIARYQSYRDAKRRAAENRELLKRHERDVEELQAQLDACLEESVQAGLEARRLMREHGYPEESRHDTALGALRSYRIRSAQMREKRKTIAETVVDLDETIRAEEENLARYRDQVQGFLAAARVEAPAQWHERARQAQEYRETRQRLDALAEKLAVVLRGQDIRALRAAVADEPVADPVAGDGDMLRAEREDADARADELTNAAHALHVALVERGAAHRPLAELADERAAVREQIAQLEAELEAAACAKALIESVVREKHARIAPRLAAQAGRYLAAITGGRYTELDLGRDLTIAIRVPETGRLETAPQRFLSKGTTDQVYLALRLAMVACISDTGESIPVLLDDPFPNYDDERLDRAMQLLAQVAGRHQVLLFTCREDVVAAARATGAPIREL